MNETRKSVGTASTSAEQDETPNFRSVKFEMTIRHPSEDATLAFKYLSSRLLEFRQEDSD